MQSSNHLASLIGISVNVIFALHNHAERVSSCTYHSETQTYHCAEKPSHQRKRPRPVVANVTRDTQNHNAFGLLIHSISRVVYVDKPYSFNDANEPMENLQPFTRKDIAQYYLILRAEQGEAITDVSQISHTTHAVLVVVTGTIERRYRLFSAAVAYKVLQLNNRSPDLTPDRVFVSCVDAFLPSTLTLKSNKVTRSPSFRDALPYEFE